jgi:hypothetical protein
MLSLSFSSYPSMPSISSEGSQYVMANSTIHFNCRPGTFPKQQPPNTPTPANLTIATFCNTSHSLFLKSGLH